MKKQPFYTEVFAYKNFLFMCPVDTRNEKPFYPTNSSRMGPVITDSKKHLRVSQEALDLMGKIRKNNDAVGDIGWWKCTDGTVAFSWFGAIYRVMDVNESEGDRDFQVWKDFCTIIPNKVTPDMISGIKNEMCMWKEPFRV